MLLGWGIDEADREGRKICLVNMPQARIFYGRAGWVLKEDSGVGMEAHGGKGGCEMCWMIREAGGEK